MFLYIGRAIWWKQGPQYGSHNNPPSMPESFSCQGGVLGRHFEDNFIALWPSRIRAALAARIREYWSFNKTTRK